MSDTAERLLNTLGGIMIGWIVSRMLDKICGLLYPSDITGLSDEFWEDDDYDE
jgi:hypothetical protein